MMDIFRWYSLRVFLIEYKWNVRGRKKSRMLQEFWLMQLVGWSFTLMHWRQLWNGIFWRENRSSVLEMLEMPT